MSRPCVARYCLSNQVYESPILWINKKDCRKAIFFSLVGMEGLVRRHWGSVAASPGNSKSIHRMLFAPHGDVPFDPLPPFFNKQKRLPEGNLFQLGGDGGARTPDLFDVSEAL